MMIKAPEDIGGAYHSYAPGHGGLSFVHVVNGIATNEPVPRGIAQKLLPDEAWGLCEINGRLEGYRVFQRVTQDTLKLGDDLYKYELRALGTEVFYEYYFWAEDEWEILRNESRRLSMKYFITHEHVIMGKNKWNYANGS